jgi:predicted RNA-binding Zn-ribbon protein involved in translation (DUF1610 family)
MGMKWQHRRCEACESELSPVREAQIHCSPRCRNRLKVRCHRSGYMVRPPTTIQEKRLHAVLPPSEGLTESPAPYFNPLGQCRERCKVTTTHLPMTPTGIQS